MISGLDDERDQEFLLALYREHYDIVRRKIRSIIGEAAEVEDICQECFLRLIKNRSRLRAMNCNILTGYIVITAKNTALDYLKTHQKQTGHLYYGLEDDLAAGLHDPALGAGQWTRRWQRVSPLVNIAAVAVVAIAIVFSTLVMNVEAVREQVVKKLYVTKTEDSIQIQMKPEWEANYDNKFGMHYLPTFLPEDFILNEELSLPGYILYSKPRDASPVWTHICISERPLSDKINAIDRCRSAYFGSSGFAR